MGVGFGGLRSGRGSRRTTIQDCIIKVVLDFRRV